MKVFVFDLAACNGCHNCQIACKDEHVDNDWSPWAKPQPDTGHFWLNVEQYEHGSTPKVRVEYRPTMCNHCSDAPCVKKSDAFYYREDGLVILDPLKANDKTLLDACPYKVIYWNEELGIAQKCTGCAHLIDEGKVPHCVDLCVIGALRFGDESDFSDEIANADTVLDVSHGPRVYYLNAPKFFIGGEIWDREADEIIEGACVSLTTSNSSGTDKSETAEVMETKSDMFGDFWFNRLESGVYDLKIEAVGYKPVVKTGINLEASINLGDFPLDKQ